MADPRKVMLVTLISINIRVHIQMMELTCVDYCQDINIEIHVYNRHAANCWKDTKIDLLIMIIFKFKIMWIVIGNSLFQSSLAFRSILKNTAMYVTTKPKSLIAKTELG